MKLFTQGLIDELSARAASSPRKRAHHNVHVSPEDLVQRFFVVADRDTYFRPHRHHTKAEMAVVLRGAFEILLFDDHGRVTSREKIGRDSGRVGYEMPPATWHTLLACENGSTFLEVKQGPYDPAVAAEFAAWAPAEGAPQMPAFLAALREANPGDLLGSS